MRPCDLTEEMIHRTLDSLITVKIDQHRLIENPSTVSWDLVVEYPEFEEKDGQVNVTKKTASIMMFTLQLPLENKEFLYVPEFLKRQMEEFMKHQEKRIHLV